MRKIQWMIAIMVTMTFISCIDTGRRQVPQMEDMSVQQVINKYEQQLVRERSNSQMLLLGLMGGFALVEFVVVIVAFSYRNKIYHYKMSYLKQLLRESANESSRNIRQNMERIKELNDQLLSTTDELRRKVLENERQLLVMKNMVAEQAVRDQSAAEDVVHGSAIYQLIVGRLIPDKDIMTEHDFSELEVVINTAYPDFSHKLRSIQKMNHQELRVSLLLKAGIVPLYISMLTAHSPQSVSSTRSRLYTKVFNEKGSPDKWDEFIKAL